MRMRLCVCVFVRASVFVCEFFVAKFLEYAFGYIARICYDVDNRNIKYLVLLVCMFVLIS